LQTELKHTIDISDLNNEQILRENSTQVFFSDQIKFRNLFFINKNLGFLQPFEIEEFGRHKIVSNKLSVMNYLNLKTAHDN
jgi:hypothetical protein